MEQTPRIGLALSGGGFRASLFHVGVVGYLAATDRLANLKVVASSSGGSLVAPLLALARDEIVGGKFVDVVLSPIRKAARTGFRERIVRRLPWLWLIRGMRRRIPGVDPLLRSLSNRLGVRIPTSATELLAEYYDLHLYTGRTMDDLRAASPDLRSYILATNVSRGGITVFGETSIGFLPANLELDAKFVDAGLLRVARAVAASSAFPALFPPIQFEAGETGADDALYEADWLTDAGVSDNLAFDSLSRLSPDLDLVVVSDAGRSQVSPWQQPLGLLTNALRSSDLMLFRISELARERASQSSSKVKIVAISATTHGIPQQSEPVVQRQLEYLRTDFDRFTPLEIDELIRHGWCAAASAFSDPRPVPDGWLSQGPTTRSTASKLAQSIQAGGHRRYKLWASQDWICWFYAVAAVALFTGLVVLGQRSAEPIAHLLALLRAQPLLGDLPTWKPVSKGPPIELGELPLETNPDFRFLAEDRVWDLRLLSVRTDGGRVVVEGPAYLQRSASVLPLRDGDLAYRFRFQTSGAGFRAWSPAESPLQIFTTKQQDSSGSSVNLQPFVVETTVAARTSARALVQVQAEIRNAFLDRNNWWAGMRVTSDVERISMRIIFPKNLPFRDGSTRFEKYPNDKPGSAQTFDGIALETTERELLWQIDRPTEGYTYRVNWDW